MSHSQNSHTLLGRLLSGNDPRPINVLKDAYFYIIMTVLSIPEKRKKHCDILMPLVGYLKRSADVSIRKDIYIKCH